MEKQEILNELEEIKDKVEYIELKTSTFHLAEVREELEDLQWQINVNMKG